MAIVSGGAFEVPRISITERVFRGLDHNPDRVALVDGPSGASLTARLA